MCWYQFLEQLFGFSRAARRSPRSLDLAGKLLVLLQ
jgi:hypothetical protein